jgi:hypothetical protein
LRSASRIPRSSLGWRAKNASMGAPKSARGAGFFIGALVFDAGFFAGVLGFDAGGFVRDVDAGFAALGCFFAGVFAWLMRGMMPFRGIGVQPAARSRRAFP